MSRIKYHQAMKQKSWGKTLKNVRYRVKPCQSLVAYVVTIRHRYVVLPRRCVEQQLDGFQAIQTFANAGNRAVRIATTLNVT